MISGTVITHGDHRIAMSFAIAGLRASGRIQIQDCANVNTSFPGFAPLDAPKVACLVVLDNPKLDSGEPIRAARTAAPIFAEVVREALDHLAVRPPPNLAAQGGAAR